jgi:hypothetical protein
MKQAKSKDVRTKRKEKEMTTENKQVNDERQIRTLIDNWANAIRAKASTG